MARMSVDDSFCRDPRVKVLAGLCGWSRRETMGALLDVWAICYDRVTPILGIMIVDSAAELSGFAAHMVTSELAKPVRRDRVRCSGVEARIKYLEAKVVAGRQGGVKSGESRRKKREAKPKHSLKQTEAQLNLPDSVPDPVSVSAPVPALASAPVPEPPEPARPPPTLTLVDHLDDHAKAKRAIVAVIGPKHAMAFGRVKQAIGSTALGPSVVDKFEQLRELLDEIPCLDGMLERCEYALAIREAEAMKKRTMQYFGAAMWKRASFEKALTFELHDVDGTHEPPPRDPRYGRAEPCSNDDHERDKALGDEF